MTRINLHSWQFWSFSRAFLHVGFPAFFRLGIMLTSINYYELIDWILKHGMLRHHLQPCDTHNPAMTLCSMKTFPGRTQTARRSILLCLHLRRNELLCALLLREQSLTWLTHAVEWKWNMKRVWFYLWFSKKKKKALKFNMSALSMLSCGAGGNNFSSCRRDNWKTGSLKCETSSSLKWNVYSV